VWPKDGPSKAYALGRTERACVYAFRMPGSEDLLQNRRQHLTTHGWVALRAQTVDLGQAELLWELRHPGGLQGKGSNFESVLCGFFAPVVPQEEMVRPIYPMRRWGAVLLCPPTLLQGFDSRSTREFCG
jgi:hypothetical protein